MQLHWYNVYAAAQLHWYMQLHWYTQLLLYMQLHRTSICIQSIKLVQFLSLGKLGVLKVMLQPQPPEQEKLV